MMQCGSAESVGDPAMCCAFVGGRECDQEDTWRDGFRSKNGSVWERTGPGAVLFCILSTGDLRSEPAVVGEERPCCGVEGRVSLGVS